MTLIFIMLISVLAILAIIGRLSKKKNQSFMEYFQTIGLGMKLLFGIYMGWVASFLLIWVLFGGNEIGEDGFRIICFIAFPMGAIIGGGFVLALNKKSNNRENEGVSQQPQDSKYQQLAQLKNLLDSGAITQEEYDAEKKELLQTK